MEIIGKLVQVLPLQTGMGKAGEWKKQDIILEIEGTYPRKLCISIWGDKINNSQLIEGAMLQVSFDIESREFNDKWYTNLKAWKIEEMGIGKASITPESNTNFPSFDDIGSDPSEVMPF